MSAAGLLTQPIDTAQLSTYRAWLEVNEPIYRAARRATNMLRIEDEYCELLPVCTLAICPYCAAHVRERFDTMSLNGLVWHGEPMGSGWRRGAYDPSALAPSCPHLRIVAWFLNLEGLAPSDLFAHKVLRPGPEVPSIMRVPMRAEGAVAVIRPLPVGIYDEPVAAHRYTTWFISYFTETRAAFDLATDGWGVHYGQIEYGNVDYDLAAYAHDGRLRWIDPATGELAEVGQPYPFGVIEGDRSTDRILRCTGVEHPPEDLINRVFRWMRWLSG